MNKLRDINSILIGTYIILVLMCLGGCAFDDGGNYHDPKMDFGAIRTIAVMPFSNLTTDKVAAERVRDTFMNSLLSTGVVYVIPPGEVSRGFTRIGVLEPTSPSLEEVERLATVINADAVITGTVREYGVVRSASVSSNIISLSLQMFETQTQQIVWSASSTKGGISILDRLFGGGGKPMNEVTQAAIDDLINKLFLFDKN